MAEDRAGPAAGITVSRYQQRDRAALLAFRRDHYGADAAQASPAYIDWQYRDAPGTAELGAPLHVAWKDGRIVGTLGTLRTAVWVDGKPEPGSWVVDFAVHRDLRRSGIGEALGAASRAERGTRMILVSPLLLEGVNPNLSNLGGLLYLKVDQQKQLYAIYARVSR